MFKYLKNESNLLSKFSIKDVSYVSTTFQLNLVNDFIILERFFLFIIMSTKIFFELVSILTKELMTLPSFCSINLLISDKE